MSAGRRAPKTADPRARQQIVATHYRAAGDNAAALPFAESAANAATNALAFDRAAALRAMVVEMTPAESADATRAQTLLADALACAGRGADAGRVYLDVARCLPTQGALQARCHAATSFLGSGYFA